MAVLTISRQFGAGGKTLGKMIAKEFGYTFADNNIIQDVAKMANVSPAWVETVEREGGTKLSKFISSMLSKQLMDRVLKNQHGYIDEKIYLDYLVLLIAKMADEDDVVILGRGSQYILSDHPKTHHILLIDESENRVKFLIENYKYSKKVAIQSVANEDKRRANLYSKLGKTNYDDPSLYHLVLNMNKLSMDDAFKLTCNLINMPI